MKFFLKNTNLDADSFGILMHSAKRKFSERLLELTDSEAAEGTFVIELIVDESLKKDRYCVVPFENRVVLRAANNYSVHAAFGRWMLESFADGRGAFVPCDKTIDFTPKDSLRGMYFATHFYNFYHCAPIEEIYPVIEDLALRGCNSLIVWFDMHHFNSMEDPGAVTLTERLHAILRYANLIGIGGSLTMLCNEAFANSPEELRAEWWIQNGYTVLPDGHYHREICPSKKGGIEKILEYRRQMLSKFQDLKIDYICYWPYDQGGCTCSKCAPWGPNGFMRLYPHFRDLVKEMMPNTKIIISTWYFDKFIPGEWDAFYSFIKDGMPEGSEYMMAFFFNGQMPEVLEKNGVPEGVRFIDFPEISMYTCTPWGGFGASHVADFLNRTNEKCGKLYDGGFPYSEGIFEDINKFLTQTYYSGLYEDARDGVRAYVRHEFCVEGAELDELTDAILKTELALERTRIKTGPSQRFEIQNSEAVEYVYRVLSKYNTILPENIRRGYKFRLWYLRALIDRELVTFNGYPHDSEVCQNAMKELCGIYHASEKTKDVVCPPVGR